MLALPRRELATRRDSSPKSYRLPMRADGWSAMPAARWQRVVLGGGRPFWLRGVSFDVQRQPLGIVLVIGPGTIPSSCPRCIRCMHSSRAKRSAQACARHVARSCSPFRISRTAPASIPR